MIEIIVCFIAGLILSVLFHDLLDNTYSDTVILFILIWLITFLVINFISAMLGIIAGIFVTLKLENKKEQK